MLPLSAPLERDLMLSWGREAIPLPVAMAPASLGPLTWLWASAEEHGRPDGVSSDQGIQRGLQGLGMFCEEWFLKIRWYL